MTRTKTLIPVAVLVIAAVAYWFLVLAPKRDEAAALATQVSAAEVQLQQAEATAAQYASSRKSYRANYTRMASLGKALPADDDVRSLLVQLDTTAEDADVEFETIDAGQQSGASAAASGATPTGPITPGAVAFGSAGMSAMPFAFTLSGSFLDLSSLLGDLEHFVTVRDGRIDVNGRLMRIESLSLEPSEAGSTTLRAQINATTYLMPATADIEAAAPVGEATPTTPADSASPVVPQTPAAVTAPTGIAR